jgi:hypothetical protein
MIKSKNLYLHIFHINNNINNIKFFIYIIHQIYFLFTLRHTQRRRRLLKRHAGRWRRCWASSTAHGLRQSPLHHLRSSALPPLMGRVKCQGGECRRLVIGYTTKLTYCRVHRRTGVQPFRHVPYYCSSSRWYFRAGRARLLP